MSVSSYQTFPSVPDDDINNKLSSLSVKSTVTANDLHKRAQSLYNRKQFKQAIDIYKTIITNYDSNNHEYLYWYGKINILFDKKIANTYLKKSISIKETSDNLQEYGLFLQLGLTRLNDAEKYLFKAVRLNPNSPKVHFNYAYLMEELYYIDKAKRHYEAALSRDIKYSRCMYIYNICLSLQKHYIYI